MSLIENLSKNFYLFLTVARLEQVFHSGLDAASVFLFRARRAGGNKWFLVPLTRAAPKLSALSDGDHDHSSGTWAWLLEKWCGVAG